MVRFFNLMVLMWVAAGPALADWPAESAAMGARDHPKVVQRFGGEIENPAMADYVSSVGAKMVAVSERPDESWTFTVLDSEAVNAFALPGGYVYVTRGLLALANNESELAAVLAHEITHVVEGHVEARQAEQEDALLNGALSALSTGLLGGGNNRVGDAVKSGVETALGQMGAFSKAQEFAADAGGIALLRRAGYRPAAQADFLASLTAYAKLKAQMEGRVYDESVAPFFADHPAPEARQLQALALAGDSGGVRAKAAYFAHINGMVYGQNQRGGFVEGQRFFHPVLGFTFEAAPGLRIQNARRQINIFGPDRSTLILSGAPDSDDLYAALRAWASQIPRRERQGRGITGLRQLDINGMAAATGTLTVRKRGRPYTLRLTVIRFGGGLVRFAGTVRRGDESTAGLHWQTLTSFRPVQEAELQAHKQTYVTVHEVQSGETVASLAAEMAVPDYAEARFRVLNGLSPQARLTAGEKVKLITY